jgi:flagellar biosynthesis protein FlhF
VLDGRASGARMSASRLAAESCEEDVGFFEPDDEPPPPEPPRLVPVPPLPPEPEGAAVPPLVPVAAATPPVADPGVLAPGTCDDEPKLFSERSGDALALPPPSPFGRGAASWRAVSSGIW